jgi:hypothetical protein
MSKATARLGDLPADTAQPLAPLDDGIVLGNLAGEGEEESKSVFGHGHVIHPGTEGHRNTQLCSGMEINFVHANAVPGQYLEARQAFLQHRACECIVATEDGVVISDEREDSGLRQGPRARSMS